jgi:hypothetical protein
MKYTLILKCMSINRCSVRPAQTSWLVYIPAAMTNCHSIFTATTGQVADVHRLDRPWGPGEGILQCQAELYEAQWRNASTHFPAFSRATRQLPQSQGAKRERYCDRVGGICLNRKGTYSRKPMRQEMSIRGIGQRVSNDKGS